MDSKEIEAPPPTTHTHAYFYVPMKKDTFISLPYIYYLPNTNPICFLQVHSIKFSRNHLNFLQSLPENRKEKICPNSSYEISLALKIKPEKYVTSVWEVAYYRMKHWGKPLAGATGWGLLCSQVTVTMTKCHPWVNSCAVFIQAH